MPQRHTAVYKLVEIMKRLGSGKLHDQSAQKEIDNLLRRQGHQTPFDSLTLFRVFKEYFQNPTVHAQEVIERIQIGQDQLVDAQRAIQHCPLITGAWQSLLYPRSLLVRYGYQLTRYLNEHPDFIDSITSGQSRMYMLEIHPTKGSCIYTCKMCLWSGGGKLSARQMKAEANQTLLSRERWKTLLAEAKHMGVERVIISGGGEPLLDERKFREVTEASIDLGIKTMIYTNGRMLARLSDKTIATILQADWIRVSMHAADAETYARLVNRYSRHNDFEIVIAGMQKLIKLKERYGSPLRIGIGAVIQETNCTHIPSLAVLGEQLGIDFLDIRGDCIGISKELSKSQRELMYRDLSDVRDRSLMGLLPFSLTIADDLMLEMDGWNAMKLTAPQHCWIPVLRLAVDPYGTVCACDSIGEPYTRSVSPDEYVFGSCHSATLCQLLDPVLRDPPDVRCRHCMPGQIALNALFEKIIADFRLGIIPSDQPFFAPF